MDITPHTTSSSAVAPATGAVIRLASREDLPAALSVQRAGFTRVAERGGFPPEELPPVRETLAELQELHAHGMRTLIAVADGPGGRVAGTVRGQLREDGTVEIGRLAVDGDYLRRGIARALMLALELEFPQAARFELFTGSDQVEAVHLYTSLGYRIYAREEVEHWTLVRLEKSATRVNSTPLH